MKMTLQQALAHNRRVAASKAGASAEPGRAPVPADPPRPADSVSPEETFILGVFANLRLVKRFACWAEPMGAPRQSRRDSWKPRPVILDYREFKDAIRLAAGELPQDIAFLFMRFFVPVPASKSRAHRERMLGKAHRVRPDTDNMVKAVQDALLGQDSCVYGIFAHKEWCRFGEQRTEVSAYCFYDAIPEKN